MAEGPESEILWIIVKDDHKEIAVGVVYFSCHSADSREQNNKLEEEDINEQKGEGRRILLMGDFNGHLNKGEDGELRCDINGERILGIVENEGLELINETDVCLCKWTWMRKNSKSCIDYVLADEDTAGHITQMEIYGG